MSSRRRSRPPATRPAPASSSCSRPVRCASARCRPCSGLAPSTVSKHLTLLKAAGLVDDRRDGRWIHYALADGGAQPATPARCWPCCAGRSTGSRASSRTAAGCASVKAVPVEALCALPPAERVPSRLVQVETPRPARQTRRTSPTRAPPPTRTFACLSPSPACSSSASRTPAARRWPRASRTRWARDGSPRSARARGPRAQVNPRAIQFMREQGIDLSVQRSKGLDDLPAGRWDYRRHDGLR